MSTTQTPLKIIGKEFLYKNEDWYYVNFNPFITSNSLDTLNESNKDFSASVNLYILDKTNFTEPTKEQFLNFKKIEDINSFKTPEGQSKNVSLNNVLTINELNIQSKYLNNERTIELGIKLSKGIVPKLISTQDSTILNNFFVVIEIPIVGTKKTYTDIDSTITNAYIMIPSNRCFNLNLATQSFKDAYMVPTLTSAEKDSLLGTLPNYSNFDIILEESTTLVNLEPVATIKSENNPIGPNIYGGFEFNEQVIDITNVDDIFEDNSSIATFTFNGTSNDITQQFTGSGYTILDKNTDTSIVNPDGINPENLSSTLNIFGDGSCLACYKFDGNVNDIGAAHNGTSAAITYGPGYIDDISGGQSAIFNGTSSYVTLASKGATLWYSGDRTVSMWFKSNTPITTTQALIARGATGESLATNDNTIALKYSNSTGTQFYVIRETTAAGTNNEYFITLPNLNLCDGNWYNLTFVYTTTSIDIFVNGKPVGNFAGMVVSDTTAPNLYIGQSGSNSWYLNGQVDQLRFFNRKLTYHEIQLLQTEKRIKKPTYIDGKFGQAIVCDPKSLFQTEASIQYLKPFTIAGWYKNTGESNIGYSSTIPSSSIFIFQDLAETGILNNGVFALTYYSLAKSLVLQVRSSTTGTFKRYIFDATVDIDINGVNHFAITYNGGKEFYSFSVFINGTEIPLNGQILTGEAAFAGFDKRLYFTPGRCIDRSAAWFTIGSGQYEQFRMFDRVLKQEEILTCMYGVKPDPTTIDVPVISEEQITIQTVQDGHPLTNQYLLERDYTNFVNGNNLVFETLSETFPVTGTFVKSVIQDGYVYVFQGTTGNSSTQTAQVRMADMMSVYQAKINNDGTLGTFTKIGKVPYGSIPLYTHSIVQYKNRVFILGGQYQNYTGNTVNDYSSGTAIYVMTINEANPSVNGNIPTVEFTFLGNLPLEMYAANAWIHANRIYCGSGWNNQSGTSTYLNTASYAEIYEEINSDGISDIRISEWVDTGPISTPTRYAAVLVQTKSRIYWIGGHNGTAYTNTIIYKDLPSCYDADGNIDYNSIELSNTPYITDTLTFPVTAGWGMQAYVTDKYAYIIGAFSNGTYNSNTYVAPIDDLGHLGQFVLLDGTNLVNNTYSAIIPTDKYLYCIGGYQSGVTTTAIANNLIRRAPLPPLKGNSAYLTSTSESYNYYPERLVLKTKTITRPKNEINTIKKLDPFDDGSCGVLWDLNDKMDVDSFNAVTYTTVTDLYGPSKPGFISAKLFAKSASQYITSSSFNPNPAGFNLSAFVRFNSYPTGTVWPDCNMCIFSFGTVSVLNGLSVMLNTSKEFFVVTRGITSGTSVINGTKKPIDLYKLYHLSVNISPKKVEIFLDGDIYLTYLYTTTISLPAGLVLGREINNSGYYHDGYIDQFRYFNKPLTSDKIKALVIEKTTMDTNLREPDFKNMKLYPLKAPYSAASGAYINTGKKLYRYDGYSTDKTTSDYTNDNAIYYSDILEDGSLSGWKYAGTSPLGYRPHYYVYDNKYVYAFGGSNYTTTNGWTNYNNIKRAPINFDGSIGAWTNIGTMPGYYRNLSICKNETDPSIIYISCGYGGSTSTSTTFYNYVFTYKINTDNSVTLLNTVTLPYIYASVLLFITDPSTSIDYLYQFGEYQSSPLLSNADIFRIELDVNKYPIVSTRTKVGSMPNSKDSFRILLKTDTDIYQVGWVDQRLATPVKGIDRRIEKINIQALLNATNTNQVTSTIIDYKVPDNYIGGFIETDYGWYMMSRAYGDSTNPSNWVDSTNIYLIPKKKQSKNLVSKTSYLPAKLNTKMSNTLKGKLFKRYQEEYSSNLVVKQSQTLTNLNETIKFKDPDSNEVITISELINPIAVTKLEEIFLEWLVLVAKDTNLEKYNDYVYTNAYGLNTARNYDLIIPEIIFSILSNKNMANINKIVLSYYLTQYPLPNGLYTRFQNYGYIDSDFNIENILYQFYSFKFDTNVKTPVTFDTNGPVVPKYKNLPFSSKSRVFDYIFIPQKSSQKSLLASQLPPIPKLSSYIDSIGSCMYKKKIEESLIDYKTTDTTILNYFNYFISPTGSNSNDGLSPYTPKATVGGCPAGSRVLLLPGTYTGSTPGGCPPPLVGITSHEVWGCGDSTILVAPNCGIGQESRVIPGSSTGSGSLNNCKVLYTNTQNWGGTITTDYCYIVAGGSNSGFTFYRVNFVNSGRYTLAGWNQNYGNKGGTIYFNNCTVTGGIYVSDYYGNNHLQQSVTDYSIYKSMSGSYDISYKHFIDNLNTAIEFTPAYTLIPITDDSNPDSNSIILENTQNVTQIPNFEFKL